MIGPVRGQAVEIDKRHRARASGTRDPDACVESCQGDTHVGRVRGRMAGGLAWINDPITLEQEERPR